MFHSEIINDAEKLNKEVSDCKAIPTVSKVTQAHVLDNYYQVKMNISGLIGGEVEKLNEQLV